MAETTNREPDLREILIDMSVTAERPLVPVGSPVYTLFVESLGAGTTGFQVNINGQWLTLQQGDTLDCGDCTPTLRGILVRTTPALAGIFSVVIVGGTPASFVQRQ